jgi:hypothetical protein
MRAAWLASAGRSDQSRGLGVRAKTATNARCICAASITSPGAYSTVCTPLVYLTSVPSKKRRPSTLKYSCSLKSHQPSSKALFCAASQRSSGGSRYTRSRMNV